MLSEPPLKIDALPAFNDKAPASAVTFGLLSNMIPITPRGVETLDICIPLGLCQESSIFPTGSLKDSISRRVSDIDFTLSSFNSRRSIKDSDKFFDLLFSMSNLFASKIIFLSASTYFDIACRA